VQTATTHPALEGFHPAVADWFSAQFGTPTPAQAEAWPAIQAGQHTLVAAPTGSGKTLAAFLAAIDHLLRQGLAGTLTDATQVVYVSPLKALSNDIQRNLQGPLAGIAEALRARGLPEVEIRTWVRTGDMPTAERERMRRRPPHILVTTPESLYILLGSASGRAMLGTTRWVIVDEIHAVAPNKRGVHLSVSLERLAALSSVPLQRIGLSATQKPIETVAQFLVGAGPDGQPAAPVHIVDSGHQRPRDLAIEVPPVPLEPVMSGEVWQLVYDRLTTLIEQHRTTLVFVNTRRTAERVAHQLSQRLGEGAVTSHHGSMSKEHRLAAEQRLKQGQLRALVATASLELGIDIGDVDLVCQLGSPRSIASLLQRVGRAGHAVGGTPKGRLFPQSRDDLVECTALLDAVQRGELDRLTIPEQPLDVLAQQIVAEVAAHEVCDEDALFDLMRRAWPYRTLPRSDFDAVLRMLADGFATARGRRGALIHRDTVNHQLKPRRGARMTALTSGGTIPETADYQVMLEPEHVVVGSVHEDFAVESLAGDVFQLGNSAYRIQRIERGTVRVEDAHGQPPNIPFWIGEAPGRSDELSLAVSRLRAAIEAHLQQDASGATALRWLQDDLHLAPAAAEQLIDYLAAAWQALGCLPTQDTVVLERFFDEAGGMQLVLHAPFGSRLNRAWGLALRKRFCRTFNFELQAAATEDDIVLSLTSAHSFALDDVGRYLHANSVRSVLVQALLDAPMFTARWRWVAGTALALPRMQGGRKVPPQFMRMQAEDLIAAVFPDQIACAENLAGEREIPDHPLTRQAIGDCLHDGMDLDGLTQVLRRIEAGTLRVVARDLTAPSPLALEVLAARPYAFLDDAPLEERRTQAVMARRWLDPQSAADLGRLDPAAIARVRAEAWPDAANADELHDALCWLGAMTEHEAQAVPAWGAWLAALAQAGRVTRLQAADGLWVAAERLPVARAIWLDAAHQPRIGTPVGTPVPASREAALIELVRGRLEGLGPTTVPALAAPLGLSLSDVTLALTALETEGTAMRGAFEPDAGEHPGEQWCDRRLLARIHRYTMQRLRAEIEPVAARDFQRFLFAWQHVGDGHRLEGPDAVPAIAAQLEGFEAPAGAWETEILPARVGEYEPAWLDDPCRAGRLMWARLTPPPPANEPKGRSGGPVRTTPITLLERRHATQWLGLSCGGELPAPSSRAQLVLDALRDQGASFFDELASTTRLLGTELEDALGELVAQGRITSDSFGGLRALLVPADKRRSIASNHRRRRPAVFGMDDAGRWALMRRPAEAPTGEARDAALEHIARTLLRRHGVVFWRLLAREPAGLPPWRELLKVYRRLEARGELRGGRFVAGFSGEQFALPEAVGLLRELRRQGEPSSEQQAGSGTAPAWVCLSAADPLNLVGLLSPGARIAALTGNRVLYRDGVPVAARVAGEVQALVPLDAATQWEAHKRLQRTGAPSALADLPT